MNYWLVKSEPGSYSWDEFVKDKTTDWTGVRNYGARNNLQAMKKGDLVFFYHSLEGLKIMGIGKVVKESFYDPTTENPAWVAVTLKAEKKLKNPVVLKDLKADHRLKDMALIKNTRLSVQPVKAYEWEIIMQYAG